MIVYHMKQHILGDEQSSDIQEAINHWQEMSHADRKNFIDSINVYTNPEWLDVRAGKFTASTAAEFLADSRSKDDPLGDSAKTLCHRVMAEQTGWRQEQNPYMEFARVRRGLLFENIARKLAEKKIGKEIIECGFVEGGPLFGCSPDGLIMDGENIQAVVEIKCPEPMAFYKQLMNCAKKEYVAQMNFAMWICNCPRAYFVLYCPEVSDKVYVLKYTRGIAFQKKLEARACAIADYIGQIQKQLESGEVNIPTLE